MIVGIKRNCGRVVAIVAGLRERKRRLYTKVNVLGRMKPSGMEGSDEVRSRDELVLVPVLCTVDRTNFYPGPPYFII